MVALTLAPWFMAAMLAEQLVSQVMVCAEQLAPQVPLAVVVPLLQVAVALPVKPEAVLVTPALAPWSKVPALAVQPEPQLTVWALHCAGGT